MGQRKEKNMTNHLTAFSWGYEGWGSAPEKFVEAADAVEASRGFGPPMFVEVRFKRSGRAPGFKEKAFEKLLGPERYRWMKGLGNAAIGGGTREIRIHDPSQAEVLLDLVERLAADKRRVLFFCGCAYPGTLEQPGCHRVHVGELLLRAAERRRVPLTVVEWPGGEPVVREVQCDDAALAGVLRGKVHLDLPNGISLTEAAAFPLGTQLHLEGPTASCAVVVGPAVFRAGKWQIPLYWRFEELGDVLAEAAAKERDAAGVNPRSVGGGRARR
ncbi:MAG TPA: hypothetical protein PLU22_02915 [Polyangiaceae bacterium]|nr:hypothetical protein [Polyangiaceae bacterium]